MLSRIAFILKRPTDHVLCSSPPHGRRSRPITFNDSRTVFFRRLLSIVLARFQVVCAVSWAILQDLYDFFRLFVCVLFPHYFRVYKSCTSLFFESDFPRSISHSSSLRVRIALRRLK